MVDGDARDATAPTVAVHSVLYNTCKRIVLRKTLSLKCIREQITNILEQDEPNIQHQQYVTTSFG